MGVEPTQQLSAAQLEALATLEERVLGADGGRLKLEWGVLRQRRAGIARDFLWCDAGRLLGFLGLYVFGSGPMEISGMVDPDARRRGIATALLDAALPACRRRGIGSALLVIPRNSDGGRALALARGAALEHSEHALILRARPVAAAQNPRLMLRAAEPRDLELVAGLMLSGFGHRVSDFEEMRETERSTTLVAELDGELVGTLRLAHDGDQGRVYAFVIAGELRGRGLGRELLDRACRRLFDAGIEAVGLEVAVDNERALGLYTSVGFTREATEDYYRLVV